MKPEQIQEMLQSTLDDYRFSRSERSAMERIFEHFEPNEQVLRHYRAIAFDLARDAMTGPESKQVLDWLEDVVKFLQNQAATAPGAAAAESHFSPGDACQRRISSFVGGASKTLDICVFTITDDRIPESILKAHRAGRAVRILTDDEKSDDPGSDINRLRKAGVDVRIDRTRAHMHHKFAIADGKTLLTGSYNWTRSAAKENEDNFIITADRRFVASFAEHFEKLWKQLA